MDDARRWKTSASPSAAPHWTPYQLHRWNRALAALGERIFSVLLEPLFNGKDLQFGAAARGLRQRWAGTIALEPGRVARRKPSVPPFDRFTGRKAISASVLRLMASRRPARFAGLVIGGNHPDLPFVDLEVSQVEAVMRHWLGGATVLAEVIPAALIAATAGCSHLHLACHGDFDEANPLQTRLILSFCGATNYDPDRYIVKARLEPGCAVVLSACESGMLHHDTGGEHLGLPAAFALPASAVIGSAWPVDDLATAMPMTRFYGEWRDLHDPRPRLAVPNAGSEIARSRS